MQITKTTDPQVKPKIIMVCYGNGGVGKTTFASTAPNPLLVDCENGAKYFGLRGIKMDVANITEWGDMKGLVEVAQSGDYETIVIDPVGELMEKLKRFMIAKADAKLVMRDGSPTIAGWGWLKDTMRTTLKVLRDSGCHILINAHVSEQDDEGKILKRPMLMTKLSDEIINMVDVVGYMEVVKLGDEEKRVIRVDSTSDKYLAKDRTGQLGKVIPPNFSEIIEACQGNKKFKWSAQDAIVDTDGSDDETEPEEKDLAPMPEKKSVKKSTVSDKIPKSQVEEGEDPQAEIKMKIEDLKKKIEAEEADYSNMFDNQTQTKKYQDALAKQGLGITKMKKDLKALEAELE